MLRAATPAAARPGRSCATLAGMTTKNVYRTLRRLAEQHGTASFNADDVHLAAPRRLRAHADPARELIVEGFVLLRGDGALDISDYGHAVLDIADAGAAPLDVPAALLDAPLVVRARRYMFMLWLCAQHASYARAVSTAAAHGYTEDDVVAALTTARLYHGVDMPGDATQWRRGRVTLKAPNADGLAYLDAVCRDDGSTPRRLVALVARENVGAVPTDAQSRGATGLTYGAYLEGLSDAIEHGLVVLDAEGIVRPAPPVEPTHISAAIRNSTVLDTMHKVAMVIVLSCRTGDAGDPDHRRWQPTPMTVVAATLRHLDIAQRAGDIADLVSWAASCGYVTVDGDKVSRGPRAGAVLGAWLHGDDPETLVRAAMRAADGPREMDDLRRDTGLTEDAFREGFDAVHAAGDSATAHGPGLKEKPPVPSTGGVGEV